MEEARKVAGMANDQSQEQKEVILDAQKEQRTVHHATLMDICHPILPQKPKYQKYEGRVVLRGNIMKDGSGSYAVFTKQVSFASQMTAAKVKDIISRLPGCDGQAADAVSGYTQVKMEDAPSLLKIPKSECPDMDMSTKTQMAIIIVQYGRPSRSS